MTLALHQLGGAETAFDTEDIAVRVVDVAPGMFAWQKYADRIDKELVRVALSDARLKKGYVVGSHDKGGWMLTPAGQEFARASDGDPTQQSTDRRAKDRKQLQRERARLLTSTAYNRYSSEGIAGVTDDDADAFFRLNVYVRGQARGRKIARIENQFGGDSELGELVKLLAGRARQRE